MTQADDKSDVGATSVLGLRWLDTAVVASGTLVATGLAVLVWQKGLRQITHADFVTPKMLGGKRTLRGRVVSVGDADNFRFVHEPPLRRLAALVTAKGASSMSRFDRKQSLHIRLAGVDAPECAHFGQPAQPFSSEALEWLTSTILGSKVDVKLFRKDRYGRIVAQVLHRPFPWLWRTDVSESMLRTGLATIYRQAGAEYAGRLKRYERAEAWARLRKRGMWSVSEAERELPAEYKRRTRQ